MGPVEKNLAAPFGNDFAHCRNWIGKQGHRDPQRDELRANLPRDSGKEGEIDFELGRVERNVHDPETTQAGGAVDTIARMTTDRLGRTHDYVAGRGERLIDSQIPQHAAHQPMVGVRSVKSLLQFNTECFDLVYMLRSREPAVGGANMTLRGACAHLGGEQRSRRRAARRLRSKQIDTSLATPLLVAFDGGDDAISRLSGRSTVFEKLPRGGKNGRIVDLDPIDLLG